MSKEQKQKEFENKWARIFLLFINSIYGFDYYPSFLPKNIPAKDIIGISRNSKYPVLNLELTEAKEFRPKEIHLTKGDIKKGLKHYDLNQVQASINNKEKKYKERRVDVSEVILLVQGYIGKEWMEDEIEALKLKNICTSFKGIYYIYPGDTNEKEFVMAIKPCY